MNVDILLKRLEGEIQHSKISDKQRVKAATLLNHLGKSSRNRTKKKRKRGRFFASVRRPTRKKRKFERQVQSAKKSTSIKRSSNMIKSQRQLQNAFNDESKDVFQVKFVAYLLRYKVASWETKHFVLAASKGLSMGDLEQLVMKTFASEVERQRNYQGYDVHLIEASNGRMFDYMHIVPVSAANELRSYLVK